MLYLRERNRDQPRPRQTLIDQLRTKIVQPPTHPSPPS